MGINMAVEAADPDAHVSRPNLLSEIVGNARNFSPGTSFFHLKDERATRDVET